MQTSCERRGQGEVGIITHDDRVFAAFGASVYARNITAYTRFDGDRMVLTRWGGGLMLACRYVVVREYHDGPLALMFGLTNGRFIIGYALGDDGMLFRGELLTGCGEESARHEALRLAEYWAEIDQEDEADPWHREPDEDNSDGW